MAKQEVHIYTRIDLIPWKGKKFYAYVSVKERYERLLYGVWLYREGGGHGVHLYSTDTAFPNTATKDFIKSLDEDGYLDLAKEYLFNYTD